MSSYNLRIAFVLGALWSLTVASDLATAHKFIVAGFVFAFVLFVKLEHVRERLSTQAWQLATVVDKAWLGTMFLLFGALLPFLFYNNEWAGAGEETRNWAIYFTLFCILWYAWCVLMWVQIDTECVGHDFVCKSRMTILDVAPALVMTFVALYLGVVATSLWTIVPILAICMLAVWLVRNYNRAVSAEREQLETAGARLTQTPLAEETQ